MGCYLRIMGNVNPAELLSHYKVGLHPDDPWKEGDASGKNEKHDVSGTQYFISKATVTTTAGRLNKRQSSYRPTGSGCELLRKTPAWSKNSSISVAAMNSARLTSGVFLHRSFNGRQDAAWKLNVLLRSFREISRCKPAPSGHARVRNHRMTMVSIGRSPVADGC